MIVALIILAVLLIITSVFLILPLEFGLEIIKTSVKNTLYVHCKPFGIPIRIPVRFSNAEKKPDKKKNKNQKSSFSFESFRENISDFKEIYSNSKKELKELLSSVRTHLSIKNVDLQIRFGFDNAATTGISTGAIWGMGSFVLKVVDHLVGIKKINMQVNPDFNNKIFEIYSKTILIIKPIHFIIVLRKVIKAYNFVNNKINNIKGGA